MNYPVYTENQQCKDCYKCVSHCPCKAIRVENGKPSVISGMCVLCGRCAVNCPSGAKKTRNDVAAARELVKQKEKVFVSLAPSFITEFAPASPAVLVSALKGLGFYAVSETSLGADLISREIADVLILSGKDRETKKLIVSSACPAVVLYIEQYAPSFIPFLNNRASPLLSHARLLRSLYGESIGVVFVGPCIAKKSEADGFEEIDGALTFRELREWFAEEGVSFEKMAEFEGRANADCFVPRRAAKGACYPIDGGMTKAIQKYTDGEATVLNMTISGMNTVIKTLQDVLIQKTGLSTPLFLELLACHGGCINGPGTTRETAMITRGTQLLDYAESADDRLSGDLISHSLSLTGLIRSDTVTPAPHSAWNIRKTLASIGKTSPADEINCAMCGYNSCRDFAIAIMEGRAEKTMCISYMRNLAQKKTNVLLHAIPNGVVFVDKNLSIIECNKNFVRLLGQEAEELYELVPGLAGANLSKIVSFSSYFGEVLAKNRSVEKDIWEQDTFFHLSVFIIEEGEIAAGLISDMTAPEQQRERTVSRAKAVIEKNVETVQKIAFLLGENAAETESILNAIIELNTVGNTRL
jgi:iron only hydrogenase large subunit-like protein